MKTTESGVAPRNVVLLGDSVFDNAKYVRPGQSVPELLQAELGNGWNVENFAVDGNLVELVDPDVLRDDRFSQATTLIFLSAGGNDALWNVDLLADPTPRPAVQAIARLQVAVDAFAARYEGLVEAITIDLGLQLTSCTIYQPVMDEFPRAATAGALAMFNDAIVRVLHRRGLTWVDLREVCHDKVHFTNVIEPSELGGARIAKALAHRAQSYFAT